MIFFIILRNSYFTYSAHRTDRNAEVALISNSNVPWPLCFSVHFKFYLSISYRAWSSSYLASSSVSQLCSKRWLWVVSISSSTSRLPTRFCPTHPSSLLSPQASTSPPGDPAPSLASPSPVVSFAPNPIPRPRWEPLGFPLFEVPLLPLFLWSVYRRFRATQEGTSPPLQ